MELTGTVLVLSPSRLLCFILPPCDLGALLLLAQFLVGVPRGERTSRGVATRQGLVCLHMNADPPGPPLACSPLVPWTPSGSLEPALPPSLLTAPLPCAALHFCYPWELSGLIQNLLHQSPWGPPHSRGTWWGWPALLLEPPRPEAGLHRDRGHSPLPKL